MSRIADSSEPRAVEDGGAVGLKARTARGAIIAVASQLSATAMDLVFVAVLARLLGPKDFGLVGMALTVTVFLSVFSEMGLSAATIQRRGLTLAQISSLFWVNAGLGLFFAVVSCAVAPLVGRFFGSADVAWITATLGTGFIFGGLTAQHSALVVRRLQFGRWWAARLAAVGLGGAAGVLAALEGWGAYALVVQRLTVMSLTMAGMWVAAGWVPGLPRRGAGVRQLIRFGGYITAYSVTAYFARSLDKVLLGRWSGSEGLGYYGRAYALMVMPVTLVSIPMGAAVTSALSKVKSEMAAYREAYREAVHGVALLSFPLMCGMAVAADDIVGVLLGSQWERTILLFRILSLAGVLQAVFESTVWIFISSGETRRMFRCGLLGALGVAGGVATGLHWGPEGVGVGYVAAFAAVFVPYMRYAYDTIGMSLSEGLEGIWRPAAATVFMATVLLVFRAIAGETIEAFSRLALSACIGVVSYSLALVVLDRGVLSRALAMLSGRRTRLSMASASGAACVRGGDRPPGTD